jgi:hypothetical protein
VDGLGEMSLCQLRFPRMLDIPKQANESLAVPVWMGQRTDNPRQILAGADGQGKRLEWSYPGQLSLQCLAFYAPGGSGLYLACDDTVAFRKAFACFGDNEGKVGCEVVHLPEGHAGKGASGSDPSDPWNRSDIRTNGRHANQWAMPYRVLLGTFQGVWVTAAERYRTWGTNQVWARKSRLRLGAVPEWVLNTGMWVWNRGRSENVLPPALALQEKLKLPVNVAWHWWHGCAYDSGFPEYLPPREGEAVFKAALGASQDQGVHALVYMNQRLWGTNTKSWSEEDARRFAVKGPDGAIHPEVYNTFTKDPCASMCLGTEFWRNKYAGLVERAVRELGVDGIYMDQACASLSCFDLTHRHPLGGGSYWMNGFRSLAGDIRQRCDGKAVSGQERRMGAKDQKQRQEMGSSVALAGEGCGEPWLPYLDLMLCLQVSIERYAAPDGWEPIPFFPAVYHAYAVAYGNYSSLTMPPYDDLWPAEFAPKEPLKLLDRKFSRQFLLEQARAFVWGQQPTVANFLPSHLEERTEETDYMMLLARLRSQATKYLLHGTFLRPPEIHAPEATLDLSRLSIYAGQKGGLSAFQKRFPLAIAGAWRAPDGDVAIALASITDAPLSLSFNLDGNYYCFPKRAKVYRTDESGWRLLEPIEGTASPMRVGLTTRGACLLEFMSPTSRQQKSPKE